MKVNNKLYVLIIVCAFALTVFGFASVESKSPFTSNDDTSLSNQDAFDKMMAVLTHKRCVNCHPAGDVPRQGEDSHLHNFDVERGDDGHGLAAYTCNTCHTEQNNDYSGVPGAPHWALAPASMAWEGKTRVEIAEQMMDPNRNGGRSPHEIEEHLTEHALVLWAWDPGLDAEGNQREKPPVGKEEYIAAVKEWIAGGAIIPER